MISPVFNWYVNYAPNFTTFATVLYILIKLQGEGRRILFLAVAGGANILIRLQGAGRPGWIAFLAGGANGSGLNQLNSDRCELKLTTLIGSVYVANWVDLRIIVNPPLGRTLFVGNAMTREGGSHGMMGRNEKTFLGVCFGVNNTR